MIRAIFKFARPGQVMIFRTLTICIFLALAQVSVSTAQADVVNFVLDASQSYADVTVGGVGPEQSQTSGTGVLNLTPSFPPFGVAQISDLDLVLDDGLSFGLLGGAVTATTSPGNVMINLVSAGAPGVVTASQFNQTGNLMGLSGFVDVLDPFNLVGGDTTLDLSTLTPGPVDFTNVMLSRTGNVVTISGTYDVNQTLDFNGTPVSLNVAGTLVASGIVTVPEPGTMTVVFVTFGLAAMRRRRSNR